MWEKIKAFFEEKYQNYQEKKQREAQVKTTLAQMDPPLTRKEYRLTGRGKYELDPQTRRLTQFGLTTRLKHKLNLVILVLLGLILVTYIILFFF
ncbi:hypothetical protein JOC36_001406 [Weissella uvarum]|uniref:hypothetical protein n=1 Tax=Weissella uvarum TaxID=1479233 RepID=UPI001961D19F|nr:hypothetical protein [Weissella uvarum]MBM7617829.1 hypothetical protein [Weissella uvarum]MCM0595792.1 hypothetical protein [Weissella uvarum]